MRSIGRYSTEPLTVVDPAVSVIVEDVIVDESMSLLNDTLTAPNKEGTFVAPVSGIEPVIVGATSSVVADVLNSLV